MTDLRLYTASEVADLLRMNHQVVQRKLQAGEIPGYRIGREWRVEHDQLVAWLDEHSNRAAARRDRELRQWFDRDGRLKALPAVHAARDAVLARLASQLEADRAFQERELNARLRWFHPDVATLRRELVSRRFLVRTRDGVYKRAAPREPALRRA